MKTRFRPLLVLALAGLAACSGSDREGEAEPVENASEVVQEVPVPMEEPVAAPSPAPTPAEATADANVAVPAEEEPSADERMMDDASATGMTSRSSRGEEESTEETQAAENEAR